MGLAGLSRIAVVGSSGSGKTTLARRIASEIGIPHLELDSIYWGPNWTPRPEFTQLVRDATLTDKWVIEGNYRLVRDLIWRRAEAIVWLNLPLNIILRRATIRTLHRIWRRESTHGGNRETLFRTLLSPNGVPWWILRSHARRRREYRRLFEGMTYPHLIVFEVHSAVEADRLFQ